MKTLVFCSSVPLLPNRLPHIVFRDQITIPLLLLGICMCICCISFLMLSIMSCAAYSISKLGSLLLTATELCGRPCTQPHLTLPLTMSGKHVHTVLPQFHNVTWATKCTRRGVILAAEVVTTPSSPSLETPVKPKKHSASWSTKLSQDQTPIMGEGIKVAMSLPPIPAPKFLAPKKV